MRYRRLMFTARMNIIQSIRFMYGLFLNLLSLFRVFHTPVHL